VPFVHGGLALFGLGETAAVALERTGSRRRLR
jgi:hypothetical protein